MNNKKTITGVIITLLLSIFVVFYNADFKADKFIPTAMEMVGMDKSEVGKTVKDKPKQNVKGFENVAKTGIITAEDIPTYTGEKNFMINNNKSGFTDTEINQAKTGNGRVQYGQLTDYNRITTANAVLTNAYYRGSKDRGSIPQNISPAGFKNKKVDNAYIYNKSHLIGYAMAQDETNNIVNLITGTRDFNADRTWGMLAYETPVQEYLKETKSARVLYQVTPIYTGKNIIATGVQMRAKSLDTNDIDYNVFIYNVQDNITINYETGTSTLAK